MSGRAGGTDERAGRRSGGPGEPRDQGHGKQNVRNSPDGWAIHKCKPGKRLRHPGCSGGGEWGGNPGCGGSGRDGVRIPSFL